MPGTAFGFRFVALGSPAQRSARIRVIKTAWHRVPRRDSEPVLIERETEGEMVAPIGVERGIWNEMPDASLNTLAPWTELKFQIQQGERKLAEVIFRMIPSETPPK